ncbi:MULTISPECIES: hypothetical protein [unclassified Bradyrhizobium]
MAVENVRLTALMCSNDPRPLLAVDPHDALYQARIRGVSRAARCSRIDVNVGATVQSAVVIGTLMMHPLFVNAVTSAVHRCLKRFDSERR